MAATKAQLRKIWASARELGIEPDELRDLLEGECRTRSFSELTFQQAREFIDMLVWLGATPGRPAPKPSGRRAATDEVKLVSGGVRDLIEQLRAELGGKWLEDPYYEGACRRLIKRSHPRTGAEGARVVEMLKARLAHEAAKRGRE